MQTPVIRLTQIHCESVTALPYQRKHTSLKIHPRHWATLPAKSERRCSSGAALPALLVHCERKWRIASNEILGSSPRSLFCRCIAAGACSAVTAPRKKRPCASAQEACWKQDFRLIYLEPLTESQAPHTPALEACSRDKIPKALLEICPARVAPLAHSQALHASAGSLLER